MSDHAWPGLAARMTRRQAIGTGLAGAAALLVGCDSNPTGQGEVDGNPRLSTTHSSPSSAATPGLHPLGLSSGRDGVLYVPSGYDGSVPAPLALMLHGATGNPEEGLLPFRSVADEFGMVLLAPHSRRYTWDVLLGGYGPDVTFIDAALEQTFSRVAVDPARLAVAGFSDGASYALSLGVSNGNLFRYIAAFAPGFLVRKSPQGKPHVFLSHGTLDQVLPIDRTSRRIVPYLREQGYEVDYREFEGGHAIALSHARAAAERIAG